MNKENGKIVKNVSKVSLVANSILFVLKIIFGLISRSGSLIADAVNSAGDIIASIVTFAGAKIASKPKDNGHPYGHGKAEYIFSFLVGIVMCVASAAMIKNSISSIINHEVLSFSYYLIGVCVFTIVVKFCLYLYARKSYKKSGSILVKSNMEDHRNDILLSLGVIISIISSKFGFYLVDPIVSILISLWIIFVGIRIINSSSVVLMDTQADFLEDAKKELEEFEEIISVDKFMITPVGKNYIAIVEVSMDKDKALDDVHEYIEKIENKLKKKFKDIQDVVIHVNPK